MALETNAFELEMNNLGNYYSHSYLPLKRALSLEEIQRYVAAQQRLLCNELVFKANSNFCLLTVARVQYSGCVLTNIEGLQWAFPNHVKTMFRHFEWIAGSEW